MKLYLSKIKEILSLKELRIFPSYLAYNFILALIPMLTVLILITSLLSISTDSVTNLIRENIPNNIADIIINIISSKNYSLSVGFLNITTLYISSRGMYALVEASDSLYKINKRKVIQKRLKSIVILFLVIFSLIFLLFIPILGSKILNLINHNNTIKKEIILIYKVLKWPLTFLIIFLNIKLIYIIAPSKKIKGREVNIGALFTTTIWALFTLAFGKYLNYFSKYDVLYGGLSSVVVLLIWLYVLSYILILGIVINTKLYNNS